MATFEKFIHFFACPQCFAGVNFIDENIVCESDDRHVYPIVNDIPRFTECSEGAYKDHWERFSSCKSPNKLKLIQAETFVNWLKNNEMIGQNILDIGCGDGSHISFVPEEVLYVAVDKTSVVDYVKEKYKDRSNLLVVQADALNLPFKDGAFDSTFSYGCINYIPDIEKGVLEIERIIKNKHMYALWGYGSNNSLLRNLILISRAIYKLLPGPLKSVMLNSMVPLLFFIPSTTNTNPFQNSWKQCCEIISTNLSPEFLEVLDGKGWDKYVSGDSTKIANYSENSGAIYQKNNL